MPYRVGKHDVFGFGERGSGFKPKGLAGFQDFQKIQAKYLRLRRPFEDDQFPANDASIGDVPGGPFIWKRPHEICRGSKCRPEFTVGGADRFDFVQGEILGNCWLLAALADLTLDTENFKMVAPEDNTFHAKEYTGAFHFRFWQFGNWIDVVIDDRLPCDADGKLAFVSSVKKNEFWGPLLEKAYAKLYGSYKILDGGLTFEALEDFTGGFTEVISTKKLKSVFSVEEFYDLLKCAFEHQTFMGASIAPNPKIKECVLKNGLVLGHAYSITDIRMVKVNNDGERGDVPLLRLRNPWGSSVEWNGDFSDRDKWWNSVSEAEKLELEINFQADGEFWMSYEDFLDNFERIEFCHLKPHTQSELEGKASKKTWVCHSENGNWTPGATAGGPYEVKATFANNPQFVLDIGEPGEDNNTFIVCLLKKGEKVEPDDIVGDVDNVTFSVFQLGQNAPKPLDRKFFAAHKPLAQVKPTNGIREMTRRFSVPSGRYCIIPSSRIKNQEGKFFLRVFAQGRSTLELYDEDVDIIEQVEVDLTNEEEHKKLIKAQVFFDLVRGKNDEANWSDLKLILDKTFHKEFRHGELGFSEDVCRSMVALIDADRTGRLGLYEFTNLWDQVMFWKKIFNKYDVDKSHTLASLKPNELRVALKAGGYAVNKDILEDVVLRYGDKKGEISLDKFIIAALKLKTKIESFKRRKSPEDNQASFNITEWLDETLYS